MPQGKSTKQKNIGFTLLEVMIALLILAISLTAVYTALTQSIRNVSHLENKMFAQWVGMNILTQFQVGINKPSRDLQSTSGDMALFNRQWHWQADFTPLLKGQVVEVIVTIYKEDHVTALVHVEGFLNATA